MIEAWHWIAAAMVFVSVELFAPNFVTLLMGLGALTVGLSGHLVTLSLPLQIALWALSSLGYALLWFYVLKPRWKPRRNLSVLIGEIALVLQPPYGPDKPGTLRLPSPLLGQSHWAFQCDETLEIGDRVRIEAPLDEQGSLLQVTALSPQARAEYEARMLENPQ